MSIPYISAATLDADITKFAPIIKLAISLVPGPEGTDLGNLLDALDSPTVLNAAVAAINDASGAKPS